MLIDIEKIKVQDRIRKDFGDIQELADDIKENGLINPPVITPDTYELIAGERRLRAMKLLGYQQIEVRPMSVNNYTHQLQLEINENESRKDFTKTERQTYMEKLIELKKLQGANLHLTEDEITEKASQESGIGSRRQYYKERFISDNQSTLSPEDFADWDEGKLSTNKAFLRIKEQLADKDNTIAEYQNKLKNVSSEQSKKYQDQIQNLNTQIELKDKKLTTYEEQKKMLERKAALNNEEAEKYKKLKSDIEFLTQQKNDISRRINSTTELSALTVQLQNVLEKDLAPIKFKRCMEVLDTSDVARSNLVEVITMIEKWTSEMKSQLVSEDVVYTNYTEI